MLNEKTAAADEAEGWSETLEAMRLGEALINSLSRHASGPAVGMTALGHALVILNVENAKSYTQAQSALESVRKLIDPNGPLFNTLWERFQKQGGRGDGQQVDDRPQAQAAGG